MAIMKTALVVGGLGLAGCFAASVVATGGLSAAVAAPGATSVQALTWFGKGVTGTVATGGDLISKGGHWAYGVMP